MNAVSQSPEKLELVVGAKTELAAGIVLFELRRPDGGPLPAFEAGAHLVVCTPAGVLRRYSLCSAPSERGHYQIGVKRDPAGTGGSVSMADRLAVGNTIIVTPPVNYFPLVAQAGSNLLIAGGIGITPILAMARHLKAIEAPFRLIYCARSEEAAAFVDVLAAPEFADRVVIHYDGGDPARALDFSHLLAGHPARAHLYCCGPRPLMQTVRDAAKHWPVGTVHFEDFGTSAQPDSGAERAFQVRLARSGIVVAVPAGISILEALRARGVDVPSSCEAGTCGSCRTGLLAGVVEHRDFVLDDDEQDSNIMICVSRAQSEELTLDA